jgi:membrane associated rhomboid family serine protease
MTPTPVGMRCPECSRERTRVKTIQTRPSAPVVTMSLIALNVAVFIGELVTGESAGGGAGGTVFNKGDLYGPLIAHGDQYWRLVSSGFLHDGVLHIAFNMIFLYIMGSMLEPMIGSVNFAFVYFASLLAGSFGALLFQPLIPTVGASGACFGVLGALIVVAHDRHIPIWQSGLGPILLINVVYSLLVTNVSIGGHLGGLVGGFITGWLIVYVGQKRRMQALALLGCVAVGAASAVLAVAVAGSTGLTPNGIG